MGQAALDEVQTRAVHAWRPKGETRERAHRRMVGSLGDGVAARRAAGVRVRERRECGYECGGSSMVGLISGVARVSARAVDPSTLDGRGVV